MAEEMKVPLYSMTAGNFGTGAKAVEKGLDIAFECCTMWNVILLLDEADAFLGERTIDGMERNEVVSSKSGGVPLFLCVHNHTSVPLSSTTLSLSTTPAVLPE